MISEPRAAWFGAQLLQSEAEMARSELQYKAEQYEEVIFHTLKPPVAVATRAVTTAAAAACQARWVGGARPCSFRQAGLGRCRVRCHAALRPADCSRDLPRERFLPGRARASPMGLLRKLLRWRGRVPAVTRRSKAVPPPPQAMQAEEALLDDGRFLKQQLQALLQVRPQGLLRRPVKLGPHPSVRGPPAPVLFLEKPPGIERPR